MAAWQSIKDFFHLSVPATVDKETQTITVPSFDLPVAEDGVVPLEGTITVEVEPQTQEPVVKVALKKKRTPRVVKKVIKR